MGRTGSADLPLHGGRVPAWLASRMARLGAVMVEALVLEEGPHGVLRRLAHPFWFQALGCVMGMDWHSPDITNSRCAFAVGPPLRCGHIATGCGW